MPTIEITVKNLDDAATVAAEQLGVSPDAVTITVLEESKKLFGKISYKVRAEAVEAAEATPAKKASKAKASPAVESPADSEAPAAPAPDKAAPRKRLGSRASDPAPAAPEAEVTEEPAKPARAAKATKAVVASAPVAPAEPSGDSEAESVEVEASQADVDALLPMLHQIIESSGMQVDLTVSKLEGRYINLAFAGKDASTFIGKQGDVLNQLQYLFNLVAKQQLNNGVRVTLDGDDFRKRREEKLTAFAMQIVEKVKERGEEAVLEALPAFERRVIHKALQGLEGVMTYSEGEEPNRRVVIAPVD